jgi:putative salt-induced outer membrane protein YdiY
MLSEAGLSTTVFKGLGFRIGSRNEYNNRPPVGVEKHDWLFTTNLTYTVGG